MMPMSYVGPGCVFTPPPRQLICGNPPDGQSPVAARSCVAFDVAYYAPRLRSVIGRPVHNGEGGLGGAYGRSGGAFGSGCSGFDVHGGGRRDGNQE
ncbi:hypothetical protein PSTT_12159 [Puccinia striiformis]|uniref:Uncharacterized protein n=1 Tax=Puccinia striiformis TaxID=27350 RepID=A0A2S4UX93_9BASI|nr:hypothetical protein PSTT_12159 [Puccinia striiformis]